MTDRIEPVFTILHSSPGYAHTRVSGTYTGDATIEDVGKKFYHPYFGGRDAWCSNGEWGCIIHDD